MEVRSLAITLLFAVSAAFGQGVSALRLDSNTGRVLGLSSQSKELLRNDIAPDFVRAIDSRITGKNPATDRALFTTQTHTGTPTYARNPACWAAGIDLTSASVWNSHFGVQGGGVLISPRHILLPEHFFGASGSNPVPNGTTFRWVTRSNVIVDRTITNKARVGDTDLCIGMLNADISDDVIPFARCLPANYESICDLFQYPTVVIDQEHKALIKEIQRTVAEDFRIDWLGVSSDSVRSAFNEAIAVGDSGGACYLAAGNSAIVVGTIWTTSSATSLAVATTAVNAVMTSLGGGYQLTPVDMSPLIPPRQLFPQRISVGAAPSAGGVNWITAPAGRALAVGTIASGVSSLMGANSASGGIGLEGFAPIAGKFTSNTGTPDTRAILANNTDGGPVAEFQQQETTVMLIDADKVVQAVPTQWSNSFSAQTTRENLGIVTKYKASATPRVNNTRTADPDLGSLSINNGEAWEFEYVIYWKCAASGADPGFSVGLAGPTGTIRYGAIAGTFLEASNIVGGQPVITAFSDPILNISAPGTDLYYLKVRGSIIATSTAPLVFKWAQQTTNAGNATTVEAGSFAIFTKLN